MGHYRVIFEILKSLSDDKKIRVPSKLVDLHLEGITKEEAKERNELAAEFGFSEIIEAKETVQRGINAVLGKIQKDVDLIIAINFITDQRIVQHSNLERLIGALSDKLGLGGRIIICEPVENLETVMNSIPHGMQFIPKKQGNFCYMLLRKIQI